MSCDKGQLVQHLLLWQTSARDSSQPCLAFLREGTVPLHVGITAVEGGEDRAHFMVRLSQGGPKRQ